MRGRLMLVINTFLLARLRKKFDCEYISELRLSWECNKKSHLLSPLIVLHPFDRLVFTQSEDLIIRSRGFARTFKDSPLFIDASNP